MPQDCKTLSCRWIFRLKIDGFKKSRLVVRGYEQEPGADYVESYSPLAIEETNWFDIVIDRSGICLDEYGGYGGRLRGINHS